LIFAFVAVVGRDGSGGPLTLSEAVAAVVKNAMDQPGSQPGKYLYIKTESSETDGHEGERPVGFTTQSWYREGDPFYWSGVTLFSSDGTKSATTLCRRKVIKGFDPLKTQVDLPKGEGFPKTSREAYEQLLANNDDDPDGLYDRNAQVWDQIGIAMRDGAPDLTPAQRATLIGALVYVPGARTLGRTTDPRGNSAVGFERMSNGARHTLYFDDATSVLTYMATTVVTPSEKHYPGAVAGATIVSDGVVEYKYLDTLPPLKEHAAGKVQLEKDQTTDMGKC
jgi:hypothetical protein